MDLSQLQFSSPWLGLPVTFGNLAIWAGLASAITCVVLYWTAMVRTMRRPADPETASETAREGGKKNGKRAASAEAETPYDRRTEAVGRWARRFFYLTSACMVVGAVSLWTVVLGQQYTVQYVWKNSNPELPFGFRFASFWADQEGTFFLWGLLNVILGSVLIWRTRGEERWVMPFFTLVQVSLFTLLAFMNPFWIQEAKQVKALLESIPGAPENVASFLPSTGWDHTLYYFGWGKYLHPQWITANGLNEQLRNFWMCIHPPTLFVGYATMMMPACFAMAALMRRDYDSWTTKAAPWLAFGWGVLGFGIFLGAYWAYETLGWGGYWSWDPVENSSLLPWLGATTLLHGLLAQRARGNFKQANLFIGITLGTLVLLGSFLVRSGVLSETSVHSFATPQKAVFNTLLGVLALWFVLSLAIWVWRFKDIQSEIAYENLWERHFGFFLGLIVLSATAVVVLFGVTLPIWKPWIPMLGGKTNVDYTFYNKALLPVVYVMVLLMTLTPLMPWRQSREGETRIKPFSKVILGLTGLVTVFFAFAAVRAWQGGFRTHLDSPPSYVNDPAYIAVGLLLALGFIANAVCLKRAARGGFLQTGGWVTHIGFLVMLAGVVVTSRFNTVHQAQGLQPGQSATLLGRQFTFIGEEKGDEKKGIRDRMLIDMTVNGKTTRLDPPAFISNQGGRPQAMVWPEILNEWIGGAWGDVYVAPMGPVNPLGGTVFLEGVKSGDPEPQLTAVQLREGNPEEIVGIRVLGFDNTGREQGRFAAKVMLSVNGVERELLAPMETGPRGPEPVPVPVEGLNQGTGYSLLFRNVDANTGSYDFALVPDEPITLGSFQVLHVPGIQVLWFGNWMMWGGALMVFFYRRKLARKEVPVKAVGEPARGPKPPKTAPELAGAE
ncbi:MAG: cytochrome c biogenesis protein CcsA [Armatimonadota bacterium]